MADSSNPHGSLTTNLPATLDTRWLTQRIEENIQVFRQTPALFEQWLLTLRSRYRTSWEIEILGHAAQILKQQIEVMNIGVQHKVRSQTMEDDVHSGVFEAKTRRLQAEGNYCVAAATTDTEVETKSLHAETARDRARVERRAAEESADAVRQTLTELERMKAANALLDEQAKRLKLLEQIAASEKSIRDSQPPPAPPPPKRQASAEDRFRRELRAQIKRAQLKNWALSEIDTALQQRQAELQRMGHDESSELWQDTLTQFDELKTRVRDRQ
jgi:hypothetical protein